MSITEPFERIEAIDPERWSDVAEVPHRPIRAAVARRLFHRAVSDLPMRVELVPSGERWGSDVASDPKLWLVRPDAVFERLGDSGLVGFGEAYLAGDLDADDLVAVLTVLAAGVGELLPGWLRRLRRLGLPRQPVNEANTLRGARHNITRHYDVSNDHFAGFLDPSMTYSAALFDGIEVDGVPTARFDQLESAQHRKIDRLLDACGVGPGSTLLEIGTGWGGLALRAAQRGAQVLTITLSEEQRALAIARIADAGLSDRASVELRDYRTVGGTYDAIISVEMIEAVGEAYWPTYLATLDRCLADGGTVALQTITMPHERMLATRHDYTWIHKYVFPGGRIPSVEAVTAAAGPTRLRVVDDLAFGGHYAETLRLWRERFESSFSDAGLSSDPTFRRMWTFYLAYSEAGFRAGYLDVHQLVLQRLV